MVSFGNLGPHVNEQKPRFERVTEALRGRVTAFLTGHEHDLQHVRLAMGADLFVSGNAARAKKETFRSSLPDGTLLFGSATWGYMILEVWPGGAWGTRFEGVNGEGLHCCRSGSASGACIPVACGN